MTTHRFIIELRWSRKVALCLAIALAVPILAITGLLTALAAHPGAAPARVALSTPTTLAYQGQVKVNGQPFNGAGQFKFAIVSADGLAAFWTNDGTSLGATAQPVSAVSLNVTAGLFNVLLGDTTLPHMTQPIGSGVFLQPSRSLRVWFNDSVNGFQQLAPDVALAAVPYALNAQTLNGLDSSAFAPLAHTHSAADIVAGTLNDARLSGNVVLGGQGVSRLSNDAGYLTQIGADARYARVSPTTQQIALLKWYTAVTGTGSTFAVSVDPLAIAFDGANMWVVNNGGNTVSVLRASDGFHVMTPTVGDQPHGIAFDGANMWVENLGGPSVSVVRASDGFHVMTPTVGFIPIGMAFDGANMWVVNTGDSTVSVLRASDGLHVMTPTVGDGARAIAFDGANMWVANSGSGVGNTVSKLRASDGFHIMTYTVGLDPDAIAFDGANMWVANGFATSVSVLRASDGFHVMTATVGSYPQGVAFDGANMWVANFNDNTVSVLRASDGLHVFTSTVGSGPSSIAFDGAFMWVTNYNSGTVSKR